MEKRLEMALLDPQVGLGGASGNHQGEWPVLARLMETQIWHLPVSASWIGVGLNQGQMAPSCISVWEKATPSSPRHKARQFSFSPYVPVIFQQLPQYWSSEHVNPSASKSVCVPF